MKFGEKQKRYKILKFDSFVLYAMPKNNKTDALLKEHEELVSLYMHESKIGWELISVYIAFSVGLFAAATALITCGIIERLVAVSFLFLLGGLYSASGALVFRRNQNQTRKLVRKGKENEKKLKKETLSLEVFKSCISSLEEEEHPKILNGMWLLTFIWFVAGVVIFLERTGLIDIPFFP